MTQYVQVVEDEGDDPIELPLESDGTLLLSTLVAQFTGACGLKYRNPDNQVYRGVRLADGRLYLPDGNQNEYVYTTVYPKEKRKGDSLENPVFKTKRLARRCSDLIVLGLPWKLTEDDLRNHFSQFGELVMVQLKRDPVSKQSKGFGFIRFMEYEAQVKAMAQRHNLEGRWCDLKIPNSKEGANIEQQLQQKIYVGRLTEEVTADDLRTYFSQYGEVTEVYVPKPFRAFAFVTFADPEAAASLCGDDHIIKGVSIHVGNATPKGLDAKPFAAAFTSDGGWNKGNRFGDGGSNYGSDSGRGSRGGYNQPMTAQNFGGFGGANPSQINSAMMAAAQAALYNFMSQAAATGGAPGFGATGSGGTGRGYTQNYGTTGNYSSGGNYGSSNRFVAGSPSQTAGAAGGYTGAVPGAGTTGGSYNGSGAYVAGMDMEAQGVAPGAGATGTRWN